MKFFSLLLVLCILTLVGQVSYAQEKKAPAVESEKGSLSLNTAENQVLDDFLQRSNALGAAGKELQKELESALSDCVEARTQKDKLAAVNRLVVTLMNANKDKQKEADLNKELQDWLKAVRNRLKCEDCLLDVDKRQLQHPVKKEQTESKKD